jgi:hypothetical protein
MCRPNNNNHHFNNDNDNDNVAANYYDNGAAGSDWGNELFNQPDGANPAVQRQRGGSVQEA